MGMPLSFEGVYKLINVGGNFVSAPMIAMAPRERVEEIFELGKIPVIQYLVPNEVHGGHTLAGQLVVAGKNKVVYRDLDRKGDDGKPVYWSFQPLTLENWNEMSSSINGHERMSEMFRTDEALREFYLTQWVDDWWEP